MSSTRSLLALALMATGLVGCERIERVSACNQLADAVNLGLADLARLRENSARRADAKTYEKVALRYEALARAVRRVSFEDKRQRDDAQLYSTIFVRAAGASKEFAAALARADVAALARLSVHFTELTASEKLQGMKLQARCVAP